VRAFAHSEVTLNNPCHGYRLVGFANRRRVAGEYRTLYIQTLLDKVYHERRGDLYLICYADEIDRMRCGAARRGVQGIGILNLVQAARAAPFHSSRSPAIRSALRCISELPRNSSMKAR
jgi:hypothetical protein